VYFKVFSLEFEMIRGDLIVIICDDSDIFWKNILEFLGTDWIIIGL